MCIKQKSLKSLSIPEFYLDDMCLKDFCEYKYLGVVICDNLSDNEDMKRVTRSIYCTGNVLISKLRNCTVQFYESYYFNLYCCNLCKSSFKYSITKAAVAYKKIYVSFLTAIESLKV